LEDLDLADNLIGDGGIESIASALRPNGTLRKLRLTIRTTRGVSALEASLRINYAMEYMTIGGSLPWDQRNRLLRLAMPTPT